MLAVSVVIGSPDLFSRRHPGRGRRSSPYDAKQDVSVTARSAISPVAAPCSPPDIETKEQSKNNRSTIYFSERELYSFSPNIQKQYNFLHCLYIRYTPGHFTVNH